MKLLDISVDVFYLTLELLYILAVLTMYFKMFDWFDDSKPYE